MDMAAELEPQTTSDDVAEALLTGKLNDVRSSLAAVWASIEAQEKSVALLRAQADEYGRWIASLQDAVRKLRA